jgi:hypothetical protein
MDNVGERQRTQIMKGLANGPQPRLAATCSVVGEVGAAMNQKAVPLIAAVLTAFIAGCSQSPSIAEKYDFECRVLNGLKDKKIEIKSGAIETMAHDYVPQAGPVPSNWDDVLSLVKTLPDEQRRDADREINEYTDVFNTVDRAITKQQQVVDKLKADLDKAKGG